MFIITLIILIILIDFGVGAVYLIRREKTASEAGNDFEILDE